MFNPTVNIVLLIFTYSALLIFFLYFIAFFVLRFVNDRLPNVCGFGQDKGDLRASLRYNAWLYHDEDPTSQHRGKIRLGDAVAEYARNRYGEKACGKKCWHVFFRTSSGRPYAVRFAEKTNVVLESIELPLDALRRLRLREKALVADGWRDSQFLPLHSVEERAGNLASLGRRYEYTVRWREKRSDDNEVNRDGPEYELLFAFKDKLNNQSYDFWISGFRPSVAVADEAFLSSKDGRWAGIPSAALIARDSRYNERILSNRSVGNDKSITASNVNSFTYESSPCYDKRLGVQTATRRPVDDLAFIERVYLRSVAGTYPAADRDKLSKSLRRFYVDCLYDSSDSTISAVDEQLRPNVFTITGYLRVCPQKTPYFDARSLVCSAEQTTH